MIYVNIITCFGQDLFIHQLDHKRYEGRIAFYENSKEDRLWDYIVVYEVIRNDISFRCKKGGLIFMSGEPEDSSPYCKKFLDQFDCILSSLKWYKKPSLRHYQTALNYHYGKSYAQNTFKYDYESLSNMPIPVKAKDMSMMCSNKTMLPGHVLRFKLYQALSSKLKGKVDFFGSGIQLVDDKADAINPYRFHICIENSSIPHYWTEKIADSLLGYAIPIYYGATNIYDYFPKEAVIWLDIRDSESCVKQIEEIIAHAEKIYAGKLPYLKEARKLLLDKYNIFPTIEEVIKSHPSREVGDCKVTLSSYLHMSGYKFRMLPLRLRRLIFKKLHI